MNSFNIRWFLIFLPKTAYIEYPVYVRTNGSYSLNKAQSVDIKNNLRKLR